MIVYEVNLEIRDTVADAFRAWLADHVAQILTLPGFVFAEILERRDPPPAAGMLSLVVCYRLTDEASLKRYFAEDAPRLREDGLRRFGDAFTTTRRVLASA